MNQLIGGYELEVATPECSPTTTLWRAKISLQDDITEVLPYLNASLPNVVYDHSIGVLLWDGDGRRYAFRPFEIDIAPVADRTDAEATAGRVIGMVNDVWSRRHEIEPSYEGVKPLPNLLDIYKLLPRTNCKECGYSNCMAFATDLRTAKVELVQCPPLFKQPSTECDSLRQLLST